MANSDGYKSYMKQLETMLEEYLGKKAPQLPSNARETIVSITPWATLIIMLIALPALFALFGLGAMMAPLSFMGGTGSGIHYLLTFVFVGISVVLEVMAIPGLFKREKRSWYLVYYAILVTTLYNIITFDLGGVILGSLLPLYVLFQIRSYYK